MAKGKRKLIDLQVDFISLVKRPATGKRFVLKSQGGDVAGVFALLKTDKLLKRAYGIVYSPGHVDAQGDWADEETIRKAADHFLLSGRVYNVDREHDFRGQDAFVAESWLVRKGDPLFGDEPAGSWAVGVQVESELLWSELESGDLVGISLAGSSGVSKGLMVEEESKMLDDKMVKELRHEMEELRKGLAALVPGQGGGDPPAPPAVPSPPVVPATAPDPELLEIRKSLAEAVELLKGMKKDPAPAPAPAPVVPAPASDADLLELRKGMTQLQEDLRVLVTKGKAEGGAAGTDPGAYDFNKIAV